MKVISVHYVALQLDLATRSTRGNRLTVKFLSFRNSSIRRPRGGQLGQEKSAKVFENGLGSPGDNTYTNQFHDVFKCLSVFLCPIRGQHLSGYFPDLIKRSSPVNSTVRRVPVWLVQDESFLQAESNSFSGAPKVYSTNFIRSYCITKEKILANSQTLKSL